MARSLSRIRERKQSAQARNAARAKQHLEDDLIPVFGYGTRLSRTPAFSLTRAQSEEFIELGWARSVNHGEGVQMCISWAELRDRSCKMGHRVMEAFAIDGALWARQIVGGWAPA